MKTENTFKSLLAISGGLIVCFFLFHKNYLLILSLVIIIIGLSSKLLSIKIHWIWNKFAYYLGYIQSKLLLFLIYFIFLTPLALIRKLFKKKANQNTNTYFEVRNHIFNKNDLENPW